LCSLSVSSHEASRDATRINLIQLEVWFKESGSRLASLPYPTCRHALKGQETPVAPPLFPRHVGRLIYYIESITNCPLHLDFFTLPGATGQSFFHPLVRGAIFWSHSP